MTTPTTKPGKFGILYLYEITYTDPADPGFGRETWRTWAYSLDHALDKFRGDDQGFRVQSISRVPSDAGMHRAVKHGVSS